MVSSRKAWRHSGAIHRKPGETPASRHRRQYLPGQRSGELAESVRRISNDEIIMVEEL